MEHILDFTNEALKNFLTEKGQKAFRANQLFEWLYRRQISSFDEIDNMKKEFIADLKQWFQIDRLTVKTIQTSQDGTKKFLFELTDGNLIETVLMHHDYGNSVCITSQVGCNMGCAFCASGMKKKKRNLEAYEMVLQVLSVSMLETKRISHVVVMGIGEPFDNYDNVLKFFKIINHPLGLEIGARHITVSTCGLVERIYEYASFDLQVNLAISLHAPNDTLRNQLMPINRAYPLNALFAAIGYYIEKSNRRVTLEYILLKDVNDSLACADELADLVSGFNVYINLIPYNEVKEKPFLRSTPKRTHDLFDRLNKRGLNVTLRKEQGFDIDAACGQLRSKHLE